MTPLQLRTALVKESGRYDLVVDTTDYADNGMDFHIEAGRQYLKGIPVDGSNKPGLFPHVVMMAARRSIDRSTSNFQAVKMWEGAIHDEMVMIGGSDVETYTYENDTDYCA